MNEALRKIEEIEEAVHNSLKLHSNERVPSKQFEKILTKRTDAKNKNAIESHPKQSENGRSLLPFMGCISSSKKKGGKSKRIGFAIPGDSKELDTKQIDKTKGKDVASSSSPRTSPSKMHFDEKLRTWVGNDDDDALEGFDSDPENIFENVRDKTSEGGCSGKDTAFALNGTEKELWGLAASSHNSDCGWLDESAVENGSRNSSHVDGASNEAQDSLLELKQNYTAYCVKQVQYIDFLERQVMSLQRQSANEQQRVRGVGKQSSNRREDAVGYAKNERRVEVDSNLKKFQDTFSDEDEFDFGNELSEKLNGSTYRTNGGDDDDSLGRGCELNLLSKFSQKGMSAEEDDYAELDFTDAEATSSPYRSPFNATSHAGSKTILHDCATPTLQLRTTPSTKSPTKKAPFCFDGETWSSAR